MMCPYLTLKTHDEDEDDYDKVIKGSTLHSNKKRKGQVWNHDNDK